MSFIKGYTIPNGSIELFDSLELRMDRDAKYYFFNAYNLVAFDWTGFRGEGKTARLVNKLKNIDFFMKMLDKNYLFHLQN